MKTEQAPGVAAAFELLIEELEREVDRVQRLGGQSFQDGNLAATKSWLARADALSALRQEVLSLAERSHDLVGPPTADGKEIRKRLPRGLMTPQHAYYLPILESLESRGGSASMADALDDVRERLQDRLNAYDLEAVPSDPKVPRWRNTAQWARNWLREQGYISAESPVGVWAITDAGRAQLAKWRKEQATK
jgi:restriction system protein